MFMAKHFDKVNSHLEPDTIDLLADFVQRNGQKSEAGKYHEAAAKLCGDSLYCIESDAYPVERFKNVIDNMKDSHDLITTDIRSELHFCKHYFQETASSNSKCAHHAVISLRTLLAIAPEPSLSVDEVYTQGRKLCDKCAR